MKCKSYRIVLALLVTVLCLAGCKGVKDIRITSVSIESISVRGFRGLDLSLFVGVDNPARQVQISEIDGSLVHSGKVIGKLAMDPFTLAAKTSQTYALKAKVSLAQGAGFKDLMMLTDQQELNNCTVDLNAKAKYGKNAAVPIRLKDIPLKELLERFGNEKN